MPPFVRTQSGVEIFANLFKAIVDEMAWIVLRSSHTTFVKETQDFAVSLVTNEGEIFAYPYGSGATPIMGVPMHAGTTRVRQLAAGRRDDDQRPVHHGWHGDASQRHLPVQADVRGRATAVLRLDLHPLHRCRRLRTRQHRHAEQRGVSGRTATAPGQADATWRAQSGIVGHLLRQLPHPCAQLGRHHRLHCGARQSRDAAHATDRALWLCDGATGDLRHVGSHRATRPPGPGAHSAG